MRTWATLFFHTCECTSVSTCMSPCSQTLLTRGSCVKVDPPTTLYSLCVRISTFLWTRAKMWDLSEPCTFASHVRCSTSAAAGEEANMYNARGRLQLMHLSCSQGGAKTLSELSSFCIPHLARQHVAHVCSPDSPSQPNVYHFSLCLQRGVSVRWRWCAAAQALHKLFRCLLCLKIFILLNKLEENSDSEWR